MDEQKQIQQLEEQVDALNREKRAILEALELAAGLGNFRISLNKIEEPQLILREIAAKVRQLLEFKAISFYLVSESDSDFYQEWVEPAEFSENIDKEVDRLIEDKTFFWALSRNKPVIVSSITGEEQLMLHSMNTSSRTRGIFVGILNTNSDDITDLSLFLFSITIISCSNSLESFELYRQIRERNDKLHENISLLENSRKELQESEEKYRALFEQAANSIVLIDTDTHEAMEYNDKAHDCLGYTREEFAGMPMENYEADNDREEVEEILQKTCIDGLYSFESRHRKKDGELIDVLVNTRCIHLHGKKYILALITDISERKRGEVERIRLEKQLRQAQKIESIGTLAGGIAHDFNNILAIILGYVELSLLDIPEELERPRGNLHQLILAVQRAKKLVSQILSFSRRTDENMVPIVVNSIIKETLLMLRSALPSTIDIKQYIDEEPMLIRGNATQLHQVITNLCTNSAQALEGRRHSSLSVTVRPFEWSGEFYELSAHEDIVLEQGMYVQITVSDNGHGIHREVLERVFDPYFTTKEPGKGTGLGLAVVHGIIRNYGGHIGIDSSVGEGTVVQILLPLLDPATSTQVPPSPDILTSPSDDKETFVL
jgi:PAS domain S-box-containing protein